MATAAPVRYATAAAAISLPAGCAEQLEVIDNQRDGAAVARRVVKNVDDRCESWSGESEVMAVRECRWGILGAAQIARKNWQAIQLAPNARLVAVASRSVERSRQFIRDCQATVPFPTVPEALGSYDELLARPDIDAVYIPLPTGLRKEWVLKAARAGKHVVVEKPVGVTAADVAEMVAVCRQHRVQLMDGVMFMHSRRLPELRRVLEEGAAVGRIRRIASQFSFHAAGDFLTSNIRVSPELEPLGCLGDLGWYNIRMLLWIMQYQLPTVVTGRMLAEHRLPGQSTGVPLEFSAELLFPQDVSASFYCSFQTENQQWTHISGTRGSLMIPDFVLPYYGADVAFATSQPVFDVAGCDFNMVDRATRYRVAEYSNSHATSQETQLFSHFSRLVLEGTLEPKWGEIAEKTQRVLDACLLSARERGREVAVTG